MASVRDHGFPGITGQINDSTNPRRRGSGRPRGCPEAAAWGAPPIQGAAQKGREGATAQLQPARVRKTGRPEVPHSRENSPGRARTFSDATMTERKFRGAVRRRGTPAPRQRAVSAQAR